MINLDVARTGFARYTITKSENRPHQGPDAMERMPALFIGHGSPMNALETNGFTRAWRRIGEALPQPSGILVISAHWFIGSTAVTAMARPRTIHDFYGFPKALFDFNYPAPGFPALAADVIEIAKPDWIGADYGQWGLDHGTWSVLTHLFPKAEVPVVQLSINASKPLHYHLALGARLAPLRERGVLILASGNVVHNLRLIDWKTGDRGEPWARRFDEAAEEVMRTRPTDIETLVEHADFAVAVPTPEHFIPLLYTAGLAGASNMATPLLHGYSLGSLSMTCYGVDIETVKPAKGHDAAKLPKDVPADQTNT